MEYSRVPTDDVSVDVLVVGAGPTGYMAACTLARYGVNFRIIDQRPERIQTGHAAGIQPRTQEVLHTMNLLRPLDEVGYHVSEMAYWMANEQGHLERTHVDRQIQDTQTPYPFILNVPQRCTEQVLDDDLAARGFLVDRPAELISFHYVPSQDCPLGQHRPIRAWVKNLYTGVTSVYRCRYLLGSDGAGSITRQILDLPSITNEKQDTWLVADVRLQTDFPDHRRRTAIRSPRGALQLIPNTMGGNRIYTMLSQDDVNLIRAQGDNPVKPTDGQPLSVLETLLHTRTREIFRPFSVDISKACWISQYQPQQRIAKDFWDRRNVFLLGDACHTHSPKAAQGMNVSMMDAYNLTWKLALVLQRRASPTILETYAAERKAIAEQLLDFDRRWSHLFTRKDFLDNAAFHDVFERAQGFTSGLGQAYEAGLLTRCDTDARIRADASHALIAGRRLVAQRLTRHIDGVALNLLDDMPCMHRFHLVVYAGNAITGERLAPLSAYLASAESVLRHGEMVDLFFIHTEDHFKIPLEGLPDPLQQWRYNVYEDSAGVVHDVLGVDENEGAMTLVRPDGFISVVARLDDGNVMTQILETLMYTDEESCTT